MPEDRMKALGIALLTLLLFPSPAGAWVYYDSKSSGETVHWETGGHCTIPFQYHPAGMESIPGMQEFTLFEDAMDLWNANPCTDVRLALDGVDDGCDISVFPGAEQNCIVVTFSGWAGAHPDQIGAAMLTVLSYKPATGFLGDVDIDVNEELFDFGLEGEVEDPEDTVDYVFAVAHELGHVYGLDHSEVPESLMFSDGDIYLDDENPKGPQADDFAGVCAVYDRGIYTCDDSPTPEPQPESEPEPDLIAPSDTSAGTDLDDGGGKKKGCCTTGVTPSPGAGFLLFALVLILTLPRRRSV